MRTGKAQDKERKKSEQNACQRMATVHPAGAFFRWSPFQVLNMHKTFRRIERTSPNKERIRRMRNGQEKHADGDERIENFVLRRCVCVNSGLTSLSTIFQSYHDSVWL